jgi:hypothetical protein
MNLDGDDLVAATKFENIEGQNMVEVPKRIISLYIECNLLTSTCYNLMAHSY